MVDLDKPVEWKGKPARVICKDREGYHSVVVLVSDSDGIETVNACSLDGTVAGEQVLRNVPKKLTTSCTIYIYRNGSLLLRPVGEPNYYFLRSDAFARRNITLTVTEGEGL